MGPSRLILSHESALLLHRKMRTKRNDGVDNASPLTGVPDAASLPAGKLAEAIGLPTPLHILVEQDKPRPRSRLLRTSLLDERIEADDLCLIAPGIFACSPELAILQCCARGSGTRQALLGYELCGTFAIEASLPDGFANDLEPLCDRGSILEKARRLGLVPNEGTSRDSARIRCTRRVLGALVDGSASPAEAKLCYAMVAARTQGGQGFPTPVLNEVIAVRGAARSLTAQRTIRPDLLWPERKLIVEYTGSHHAERSRMERDAGRDNALVAMGYDVVHVTRRQLESQWGYQGIMSQVRGLLGARQQIPSASIAKRQEQLRAKLFGHGDTYADDDDVPS